MFVQREGTAVASMTTTMMEHISTLEGRDAEEEETIARNTTAVAYGGQYYYLLNRTSVYLTFTVYTRRR